MRRVVVRTIRLATAAAALAGLPALAAAQATAEDDRRADAGHRVGGAGGFPSDAELSPSFHDGTDDPPCVWW